MILDSLLLPEIARLMQSENDQVRVASVWCVTNLAWNEREAAGEVSVGPDTSERLRKLCSAGFEERLQALKATDPSPDVRHQAGSALDRLTGASLSTALVERSEATRV